MSTDTLDLLESPPALDVAPLAARLVQAHGATWITRDTLAAFVESAGPGDRVLFFSGDPVRFPEGQDVAVVLPELQRAFPGRFSVGVVSRADEDEVARRYGSTRWPSLVFLRGGRYVTTVAGMLDWTDYLERIQQALDMPVSRAPGIGIAVVAAQGADGAGGSGCH